MHLFSDAARANRPSEVAQVEAVRTYLRSWAKQHNAELHEAETNQGLRTSIVNGVTRLTNSYGRAIVLEDDIIVSPFFLDFMHAALDAYEDDDRVCQISGYFVPHKDHLPEYGFLRAPASWGWATWRDAWRHYSDDAEGLLKQIEPRAEEFDLGGIYSNTETLRKNVTGEFNTWAVRWYASNFLQGGLTLYPRQSYTRNIGFDVDGTNCQSNPMEKIFRRQKLMQQPIDFSSSLQPSVESPDYLATLQSFYRWQTQQWTKSPLMARIQGRLKRQLGIK